MTPAPARALTGTQRDAEGAAWPTGRQLLGAGTKFSRVRVGAAYGRHGLPVGRHHHPLPPSPPPGGGRFTAAAVRGNSLEQPWGLIVENDPPCAGRQAGHGPPEVDTAEECANRHTTTAMVVISPKAVTTARGGAMIQRSWSPCVWPQATP